MLPPWGWKRHSGLGPGVHFRETGDTFGDQSENDVPAAARAGTVWPRERHVLTRV